MMVVYEVVLCVGGDAEMMIDEEMRMRMGGRACVHGCRMQWSHDARVVVMVRWWRIAIGDACSG